MNRITSDNTFEMNMHQLALNQVYIEDGWVWYRNAPEDELSVCDLIRSAAEALMVELPILSDDNLSDLLADWLQYGTEEPEGVLAILYRALCAMAEVRARLAAYEDTGLMPEEIIDLQQAWDMYGGEEGITALLTEMPCYKPDGDGCAYQVYDGDDEPIDRCKECPLCYVDKQRHRPGPNAPLTLEDLREMDGEPVWITPGGFWALVIARHGERVRLINHEGEVVWADKEIELVGPVYCRKPERTP